MRAGFQNKQVLHDSEGNFVGFCLGSDFCAEHEWGIRGLRDYFGIPGSQEKWGIEARTITHNHGGLIYVPGAKTCKFSLMVFDSMLPILDREYPINNSNLGNAAIGRGDNARTLTELRFVKGFDDRKDNWEFNGAWSDKDFGILVDKKKYGNELKELYDAFERHDVAIYIGNFQLPVFDNGGLLITIASKIPQEAKDKMYEIDKDAYELRKASDKTGIHQYVKDKGKRFFAISPRWKKNVHVELDTKYDVVFWLNGNIERFSWGEVQPSGIFSVEQLKDWADGTPDNAVEREAKQKAERLGRITHGSK